MTTGRAAGTAGNRQRQAALAEVLGPEAALSKSTVSRICQRIRTEFDGSQFKMHPGAPAEPVLAAWGETDEHGLAVGVDAHGSGTIFDVGDAGPGVAAIAVATRQAAEFAAKWKTRYPAAVACVTDDLASLTVHLRFPAEHWKRIRHSNFIERTFGETRRRVKVIGRLPGESSCLSLARAVLDRASRGWRGLTLTPQGTAPAARPAPPAGPPRPSRRR